MDQTRLPEEERGRRGRGFGGFESSRPELLCTGEAAQAEEQV